MCTSNHHIVHCKYITIFFVNYTSLQLEKINECVNWLLVQHVQIKVMKTTYNFSFSISGWDMDLDYYDIEWFALETDHCVIFEIAPKYCISDFLVDYEGYSHFFSGILAHSSSTTVVTLPVIFKWAVRVYGQSNKYSKGIRQRGIDLNCTFLSETNFFSP